MGGVAGFVNEGEALKGKAIIYLDVGIHLSEHPEELHHYLSLDKAFLSEWLKKIKRDLIHEAEHIVHLQKNADLKHRKKASERMKEKLNIEDSLTRGKEALFSHTSRKLRVELFDLLRTIVMEGIAQYCALSDKSFTPDCFKVWYYEAKNDMEYFLHIIDNLMRHIAKNLQRHKEHTLFEDNAMELFDYFFRTLFIDNLDKVGYSVGIHVIYSIIYLDPETTVEELEEMRISGVCRRYEALMEKAGYRPVISYTSGKGIFDYKSMVHDWWKLFHSYLKGAKT